jgi:hypothetical protein
MRQKRCWGHPSICQIWLTSKLHVLHLPSLPPFAATSLDDLAPQNLLAVLNDAAPFVHRAWDVPVNLGDHIHPHFFIPTGAFVCAASKKSDAAWPFPTLFQADCQWSDRGKFLEIDGCSQQPVCTLNLHMISIFRRAPCVPSSPDFVLWQGYEKKKKKHARLAEVISRTNGSQDGLGIT